MKSPLSKRLLEILSFIHRFSESKGFSPTIQEIADQFKIAAPSALDHVSRLENAGFIKRTPKQWRSIQVIDLPFGTIVPLKEMIDIPILGRVRAGAPVMADENMEGHLHVESTFKRRGENLFALKVKGDSMVRAGIKEGDFLIVRQQPTAENRDIVVALINDETTVKRLKYSEDGIELLPENPKHKPIIVGQGDDLRIIGKALAIYRMTHTMSLRN